MTQKHFEGDGVRLAQLLEISRFDADFFWPNIPLLLVLGDEAGFAETGVIRPPGVACSSTGLLDLSTELESCPVSMDALVIPVCCKGEFSQTTRAVSVGRSPGNDICLNHSSVSKFHAQFLPPRDSHGWRIRDSGSLNGSWIEGLRLSADEPLRARSFSDLTFGSLHCRFVQPGALTALVRLICEQTDEKSAADTDPDIPPPEPARSPTETWRDF